MNYFHWFTVFIFFAPCLQSMHSEKPTPCDDLHKAVKKNNYSEVTRLQRLVDVDCRDKFGRTSLHIWAEANGSINVFFQLYYRGSATLDAVADDGTTPFLAAIRNKNHKTAMLLKNFGAPYNPVNINAVDKLGYSALHIAVLNEESIDFVRLLLDMGVDRALTDSRGRTASKLASLREQVKLSYVLRSD